VFCPFSPMKAALHSSAIKQGRKIPPLSLPRWLVVYRAVRKTGNGGDDDETTKKKSN